MNKASDKLIHILTESDATQFFPRHVFGKIRFVYYYYRDKQSSQTEGKQYGNIWKQTGSSFEF